MSRREPAHQRASTMHVETKSFQRMSATRALEVDGTISILNLSPKFVIFNFIFASHPAVLPSICVCTAGDDINAIQR